MAARRSTGATTARVTTRGAETTPKWRSCCARLSRSERPRAAFANRRATAVLSWRHHATCNHLMNERRYSDEEVAAIFGRATEGASSTPVGEPQEDGLTLAELQDIGREVGIAPTAIAAAARTLVPAAAQEGGTFLGLPVS